MGVCGVLIYSVWVMCASITLSAVSVRRSCK